MLKRGQVFDPHKFYQGLIRSAALETRRPTGATQGTSPMKAAVADKPAVCAREHARGYGSRPGSQVR